MNLPPSYTRRSLFRRGRSPIKNAFPFLHKKPWLIDVNVLGNSFKQSLAAAQLLQGLQMRAG